MGENKRRVPMTNVIPANILEQKVRLCFLFYFIERLEKVMHLRAPK
jgi:hypothetical protein